MVCYRLTVLRYQLTLPLLLKSFVAQQVTNEARLIGVRKEMAVQDGAMLI